MFHSNKTILFPKAIHHTDNYKLVVKIVKNITLKLRKYLVNQLLNVKVKKRNLLKYTK